MKKFKLKRFKKNKTEIPFGVEVKDKITRLKGIVTAKTSYITGCDQYLVQPQGDGDKYPEGHWIDVGRLVILNDGKIMIDSKDIIDDDDGCDIPAPKK